MHRVIARPLITATAHNNKLTALLSISYKRPTDVSLFLHYLFYLRSLNIENLLSKKKNSKYIKKCIRLPRKSSTCP